MPRPPRRPLALHVSALSDAEYNVYTSSLAEAIAPAPDVDWDYLTIGVREARGWIKGRYGIDGAVVDQILRYFSPELSPQDSLSAGQFFATLRLVSHAQSGATVGEDLVFIQANPERQRASSPIKPDPLDTPHSAKSAPPPPPRPANSSLESGAMAPSLPSRTGTSVGQNPFGLSQHPESPPPPHIDKEEHPPDPPMSSNPFRRSFNSPGASASLSSARTTSSSPASIRQQISPPLPPRKPLTNLPPPPRHASLAAVKTSPHAKPSILPQPPAYAHPLPTPPIKPPKPPQATSPLIKQSLLAAKEAQTEKEELEVLKKLRKLEVIKKSNTTTNSSGEGKGYNSPSPGSGGWIGNVNGTNSTLDLPSPPRGRPSSPSSSFYDVAIARIGTGPRSGASSSSSSGREPLRSASPTSVHSRTHTDPSPIPLFSVDPASPVSPTTPRRTKSLNQPRTSPATPPTPPPRRRPESIQITPPHAIGNGHEDSSSLSRHLSMTSATLHRAFEGLRPGPGFESMRIKAEGRVWPGGYVKGLRGDGERLVKDSDDGFGQDVGEDATERDSTKAPVEIRDGWRPLG